MSKLKYYDGTDWKIVNGQVTGDTLPIGAIVPFGGWDAPTGWLICDGTLLNKTDYPELYDAIGYSFGGEEGGSTFGLPDLRGRVPLGLKETDTDFNGMGLTGGEKKHTLTVNEMPSHNHDRVRLVEGNQFLGRAGGSNSNVAGLTLNNGQYPYDNTTYNNADTSYTGGGQAHNNLQPYQTVNYIIKATQSAGLIANVSKIYSTSEEDTYACSYINNLLQTTTETITIGTINAGSGLYDQTSPITIPSGYIPIAIAGYSIAGGSSASINVARLQINGTNIEYSLFNSASTGSSASTSTLNVKILFIKATN